MWVYVPSKFLASAPEQGDSIEASTWRSEMLAQSCALNTKQLPPSSWLRAWRKGTWMTALFGLISTPSTAERGVAAFRASLLEYPASLIAWPGNGEGPTTSATSGLSLQGSFELFSPDGSSSKTSPESSATILSASGPNYQRWVSGLRRRSSRRRKLARHTSANGSSYWPTAVAHDDNKTAAAHLAKKPGRTQVTSLNIVATEMWPTAWITPTVQDSGKTTIRWRDDHQNNLTAMVEAWQTPAADSFRSRGGERVAEMGLDQQARGFWGYPPSLPATAGGEMESPAGSPSALPVTTGDTSSASTPASRRRLLNPKFVSWMMGWPPSWTSLAPLNCGSPETVLYPNRPALPSGSSNWPTPDTMNDRGGR